MIIVGCRAIKKTVTHTDSREVSSNRYKFPFFKSEEGNFILKEGLSYRLQKKNNSDFTHFIINVINYSFGETFFSNEALRVFSVIL